MEQELEKLNNLLQNFIIFQLLEKGLGREDIKKVIKDLDNRDYTRIYKVHKRNSKRKK